MDTLNSEAALMMQRALKRLIDLVGSCVALVLFAVPMLVIAILVRIRMGSPVLFSQVRPGLGGRPIVVHKFRTMNDARDERGMLLPDAQRLTALGTFLRRSSLDELPELFDVLRGDMSLVGPRPLLTRYLPYFTPREQLRHTVKPGMTGWAQINGRNLSSWDHRLGLDAWYVENWSLWLDVKILLKTIPAVLNARDVVVDPRSVGTDLDIERTRSGDPLDPPMA